MLPSIRTELPGPKTKALIERDSKVISPSYTRGYPLVAVKGQGCLIEDPDGNLFLDASSGIGVTSTGHCHPDVVKAAVEQTESLIHMSGTDFYYPVQIDLAERLDQIAPEGTWKTFFANSGAEAIEACLKLARWKTGRPNLIAFAGAFHGRTMGALSLTCSKSIQKQRFHPLLPGVYHAPYANPAHGPFAGDPDKQADYCGRDYFEKYLFAQNIEASSVAAIVVEPIQGEGGYVVPPQRFLKNLRELCDRHGILLVFDEVQSGMGRTGKMFAFEHFGVVPDMIAIAKGIASGFPLGVCLAKEEVMQWPPGTHASTFGGNPVACAAALETLRLLENGLILNAKRQGESLMKEMQSWAEKFDTVANPRGKGLMLAIDFVDPKTKAPRPDLRNQAVDRAFAKGVLVLGCGKHGLRFIPPLTIMAEQIQFLAQAMEEVLEELEV